MERTLDAETYARCVSGKIESDLNVRLLVTYNGLAENLGFERIDDTERFDEVYRSGYADELTDAAIRYFEELGMPLRTDGWGC